MKINPIAPENIPLNSLQTFPTWLAIVIFIFVFGVVLVGQHFLFTSLRRWIARKGKPWHQLTLKSIDRSIALFVVAGALSFVPLLFPPVGRWGQEISLLAAFLTVLALALFVQRLLMALHHRYIMSQESLKTYWGLTRVLTTLLVYSFFS